jgi:hypothetical protein
MNRNIGTISMLYTIRMAIGASTMVGGGKEGAYDLNEYS